MILVRNLRLSPDEDISLLPARAAEKLRIPASQIERCILKKRSLDASSLHLHGKCEHIRQRRQASAPLQNPGCGSGSVAPILHPTLPR